MVATNQKSTIDIHTKMKKESKHSTKDGRQTAREKNKRRREEKRPTKNLKTINKMAIRTYILVTTLNVNGLKAPTKRCRLAQWIQKQDPYICCLQETHFRSRDTCRLKVRGQKKIFHANGNQKKAGVAILISDKTDFKDCYKRQRRTLHSDQGINPRRKYNNCKYLCIQHRSTLIYKGNANSHKRIHLK